MPEVSQFNLLAQEFGKETDAVGDGTPVVPGAPSLFNPFNIFRYSKFGLNPNQYRANLHFDTGSSNMDSSDVLALNGIDVNPFGNGAKPQDSNIEQASNQAQSSAAGSDVKQSLVNQLKPFTQSRTVIENPTASNIIEWSKIESTPGSKTAKGPTPYTATDFLYCKYYGKVPNNRLVTLRRYPIPIEDNLAISAAKTPMVPLAQAITWYGSDIGNKLGDILNLNWGLNWTSRQSKVQDITGNELTVDDLIAALPAEIDPKVKKVLESVIFTGDNGKIDILKLTGYDVEAQKYIKEAYGENGPYWNRILGPVNVVDKTQIRNRGFRDTTSDKVKMTFNYSLRSYKGLNPKMVFLDLYSNFLSLTNNSAPFWGGGARYFQQTGVTLPALGMEQKMFDGDMLGAVTAGAEELSQLAASRIDELIDLAKKGVQFIGEDGEVTDQDALNKLVNPGKEEIDSAIEDQRRGGMSAGERLLAPKLGKLLRKPLIYRSLLDGRAVGEWHVTVGNPMNPMAMMGNLCLDNVSVNFSETLGIDDFPDEVSFTVTLSHGRIRAKQDFESIFNLGNGAMTFNQLAPPSSSEGSYSDRTTDLLNNAYEGDAIPGSETADVGDQSFPSLDGRPVNETKQNVDKTTGASNDSQDSKYIEAFTNVARDRVGRMYGEAYKNSPILADYFRELKTKG